MVRPKEADSSQRWQAIIRFYKSHAAMADWEFLQSMIDLSVWIERHPMAAKLWPLTSHASLCISLVPGYNPDLPFFAVEVQADGSFMFRLLGRVGDLRYSQPSTRTEVLRVFEEFVSRLVAIS
jgi:hypothetical protein